MRPARIFFLFNCQTPVQNKYYAAFNFHLQFWTFQTFEKTIQNQYIIFLPEFPKNSKI